MNDTARTVLQRRAQDLDRAAEDCETRAVFFRTQLGEAEADAAQHRLEARQLREAIEPPSSRPSTPPPPKKGD